MNNWATPSTFGWSAVDNDALNSVFTNFFNKFSANSAQTANNADLSTISNPFSFGNLASGWSLPAMNWSFPQTNWSLASTSSGGDWFSNAFGSLGSLGSLGSWGPQGGSNTGPVQYPSFISQKNVDKLKTLDPDMQKAVVELLTRARARGINVDEVTSAYRDFKTQQEKFERSGGDGSVGDPRYSQHVKGKAVDLAMNNKLKPEDYAELGRIWRDEMGFTYGMDFPRKKERWHFDLRPNGKIYGWRNPTNKGMETTWLGKGGQPSYASGGDSSGGWLNSLGGGYSSWSMPVFSSSMGGFGSGFGGSWFDTTFSSGLGGWGSSINSAGGSKTSALRSKYSPMIERIAGQYGRYGNDAKLMSCLIEHESSFDPDARSSAGAEGLTQLMPKTARELGVTNRKDPEQSIKGGTIYLNRLLKRYNGNIKLALVAYRSGPGYVDDMIRQYGNSFEAIASYITPGARGYAVAISGRYDNAPVRSYAYA